MSARQPHIVAYLPTRCALSIPIHGHAFRLYWTTKSMPMAMAMTKPNEKAKPRLSQKLSLGLGCLRSIIIASTPSMTILLSFIDVGVGVGVAPRHYNKNAHCLRVIFGRISFLSFV